MYCQWQKCQKCQQFEKKETQHNQKTTVIQWAKKPPC